MSSTTSALLYEEPSIVTILIYSSFVLLLNVVNYVLNKLIYCGLIGQIFLGVGWGIPGADWLPLAAQETIVQLGYLGLILIVYEGGLSTSIKALKANLFLSGLVACVGIGTPIALSFVLQGLLNITPLQAFAAGAALCSTSLGTIFTVLSTSGLTESRLGVILTSAAMMDDVVGLVMVQVISTLGQTSTNFKAVTVVRPICVSIAFAVATPLLCKYICGPLTVRWYQGPIAKKLSANVSRARRNLFLLHTAILVSLVTASSYAGTSNLFAAYLAGVCVTWWDGLCSRLPNPSSNVVDPSQHGSRIHDREETTQQSTQTTKSSGSPGGSQIPTAVGVATPGESKEMSSMHFSGTAIYHQYYEPAVSTVLKPFFFASIGFSIPITKMFTGSIVWRGIVYAALMVLAKLVCGLCLVQFGGSGISLRPLSRLCSFDWRACWSKPTSKPSVQQSAQASAALDALNQQGKLVTQPKPKVSGGGEQKWKIPKPLSLYPAAILGSAMVARGEIGFLISSVAESKGIYGSGSSELFLVVTWAILLCTLLGPVVVGLLVRRIKKYQENGVNGPEHAGRGDPLGVWGVVDASP